jgi:hypothetical protein
MSFVDSYGVLAVVVLMTLRELRRSLPLNGSVHGLETSRGAAL